MSSGRDTPEDFNKLDWFMPAILSEGDVHESLGEVIRAEQYKLSFVAALQTNLCAYRGRSSDSLTELRKRVRQLETTLNFRLGMLAPERQGAWFRESARQKSGPFPANILGEPVFAMYEAVDADRLRQLLSESWRERKVKTLPFKQSAPCLWVTLLELNQAYEQIVALGKPFQEFRLDALPELLPSRLAAPSLVAFLGKVRELCVLTREELDRSYAVLWQASCRFWDYQKVQASRPRPSHQYQRAAEDVREKFRERRRESRLQAFLTPIDAQSLKVFGFEDLPEIGLLRRRYRELARDWHPDRNGGDEERFKALARAYTHLLQRVEKSKGMEREL